MPSAKDKNPEWRDTAVFTLAEVSPLIYDRPFPQDRRVCYALHFLGCCRFGEAAAARCRLYEPDDLIVPSRGQGERLPSNRSTFRLTMQHGSTGIHPGPSTTQGFWVGYRA